MTNAFDDVIEKRIKINYEYIIICNPQNNNKIYLKQVHKYFYSFLYYYIQ